MYLVKIKGSNTKAHIWYETTQDSMCKMFSTGGLRGEYKKTETGEGRALCKVCLHTLKKQNRHKKPEKLPKQPVVKEKKTKKSKRKRISRSNGFYSSREWKELRYRVLRNYGGECMLCGRSYRTHKVIIHVDHIKPRSKHPHLALVYDNLQVLCSICNEGKSNKDDTDWRPDESQISDDLDEEYLESIKHLI